MEDKNITNSSSDREGIQTCDLPLMDERSGVPSVASHTPELQRRSIAKEGYKKTKLGWIPEDWKIKSLDDIGDFSKGKGIAKMEITSTGKACIRYAEIYTKYNFYADYFDSYINEESATNSRKISYGDLLFAGSGETLEDIGKCVAYLGKEDAFAGGDIVILSPREEDAKFLGFLLNHTIANRQKHKLGQGHSVVHIYSSGLKKLKVPLPPIKEQQKIATILSTWDSAITKQEQLITAKQLFKKGLMQLLLTGKKRFEGFKEEWEEARLGDIGLIQTGNTPSKKNDDFWNGEFYWATADDMDGKYIIDTYQKLSKKGVSKARVTKKGSVLVTCIASIGKNSITKVDTGFNQQINSITTNEYYDNEFAYYLIDYNPKKLLIYAGAGAMPMLNKNTFMSIKFWFPKLKEQQKIASVLSAADKEIEILQSELATLRGQKRGLMQRLLTGAVRVKIIGNN